MSITEPSRPSTLIYVPNDSQAGVYLVPSDVFHPAYFKITPLFHRTLTSFDHLLAALFVLILCAILTSAVHTILLRTTSHNPDSPLPSRTRLLSAALLSDLFHLRIPLYLFQRQQSQSFSQARAFNPRPPPTLPPLPIPAVLAIVVFVTTLALASVNLLILVVASYTRPIPSTTAQYALHGIQPIASSTTTSKKVTRLTTNSVCTSPIAPSAASTSTFSMFPRHQYILTTCVSIKTIRTPSMREDLESFGEAASTTTRMQLSLSSTFHSGGADHNITIDNKTVMAYVRVSISHIHTDGTVVRKPLLFRTLTEDAQNHILYLHKRAAYFVHSSMSRKAKENKSARKRVNPSHGLQRDTTPNSAAVESKIFKEMGQPFEQIQAATQRHQFHLSISQAQQHVHGRTLISVELERQLDEDVSIAHEAALESLVPTMGVVEAEGGSNRALANALKRYLNFSFTQTSDIDKEGPNELQGGNNDTSYTTEGLLRQEGRAAGVLLLAVVTSVGIVLLIGLRWRFSPTSLGELAWQYLEGVQSRREWLAMHPQRSQSFEDRLVSHDLNDNAFGDNLQTSDRNFSQSISHSHGDGSTSSIGIDSTMRKSMSVYVCPPTDV